MSNPLWSPDTKLREKILKEVCEIPRHEIDEITVSFMEREVIERNLGIHSHNTFDSTNPFKLATHHPNQTTSQSEDAFLMELMDLKVHEQIGLSLPEMMRLDNSELERYIRLVKLQKAKEAELTAQLQKELNDNK